MGDIFDLIKSRIRDLENTKEKRNYTFTINVNSNNHFSVTWLNKNYAVFKKTPREAFKNLCQKTKDYLLLRENYNLLNQLKYIWLLYDEGTFYSGGFLYLDQENNLYWFDIAPKKIVAESTTIIPIKQEYNLNDEH